MSVPHNKLLILSSNPIFVSQLREAFAPTFQVETATSVHMAEFLFNEWEPQACVVEDSDLFLAWIPIMRGNEKYKSLGVVAISPASSKNEEKALRMGCDHWVNYEDGFDKAVWRIQSLLRKTHGQPNAFAEHASTLNESNLVQFENLKIYTNDFLIKRMGQVVSISPTQFKLLSAFISHPDQLLSRDWIKNKVWPESDISLRSIDAHISKLRKVLPELDPYLMNIYGKGYIFSRSRQEAA